MFAYLLIKPTKWLDFSYSRPFRGRYLDCLSCLAYVRSTVQSCFEACVAGFHKFTTVPCSCLRLLQVHTFGLTVRSTLVHLRHSQGPLGPAVRQVVHLAARRFQALNILMEGIA